MHGNLQHLSVEEIDERAQHVATIILAHHDVKTGVAFDKSGPRLIQVFGVPRGGVSAALAIMKYLGKRFYLTSQPLAADLFIDDLIDSGRTRTNFQQLYNKPFYALYDKLQSENDRARGWMVFPWEGTAEASAEDITIRLLQYIGEDAERDGLKETPGRVARAWKEWTSGYTQDVESVFKTFEMTDKYNELVIVRNLPFYSHCEHHLAPFFGTATIGYIPTERIVGLSKLGRVLQVFSRRLQVQERLTTQIADAIQEHLGAKGVGVSISARHLCMESRGLCQQGHNTVTQALRGVIYDDPRARAEFLQHVR